MSDGSVSLGHGEHSTSQYLHRHIQKRFSDMKCGLSVDLFAAFFMTSSFCICQ